MGPGWLLVAVSTSLPCIGTQQGHRTGRIVASKCKHLSGHCAYSTASSIQHHILFGSLGRPRPPQTGIGRKIGHLAVQPAEPPPSRTARPESAEPNRRRTHCQTIPSNQPEGTSSDSLVPPDRPPPPPQPTGYLHPLWAFGSGLDRPL